MKFMEKVCKASIKKYFLVLIILFSSFTCSFAYYPTEEEVIIGFGVPAYINDCAFGFGKDDLTKCAYIGEPRPIIKCYQKNGQRICRKTYRQEDVQFYRKILEKHKLLKPGERAIVELIQRRIQEREKSAEKKWELEQAKAKNKKIQGIKNSFYEF